MKKARKCTIVLLGALLLGSLAACTTAGNQPAATTQVQSSRNGEADNLSARADDPYFSETSENGRPSGSLIIATQNETPSIAPAKHNAAAGSFKNVMTHNGLFRTNYYDLEPVPDLVASWEALSDVLFKFTLHEGILFHNGDEMTAEDVVASFYYVRQFPDTRASHLSAVAAEVVDRYTFTLYTGEPNAALFSDLTLQGNFIMPKSLIESGHDFTTNPIGSGPFVFEEWRFGDFISFRAFEDYFDSERAAQIENITWRIIPEGTSRTIALEAGEVDLVVEVPEPDVPRLLDNSDINVFMREGAAYNMLLLNNSRPQFENIVVRQALNMAVDQEALVAVAFDGLAVPIREQVPIVFAGTSSEGVLPFDPEGARALLLEHGIDPESLAFDMIASTEERRRMGEVVQAQLAEIGIPTTITMMDHATTIQRSLDGDYEAVFGMWSASSLIPVIRGVYYGGIEGSPNRSRVDIPELNELINLGIATIDIDERNAIFEDVSRKVNQLVVNIPTHLPITIRAFNSNLIAPELNAVGGLNLNTVHWAQ